MAKDKKKGFFSNISMRFGELAKRLGLVSNSDINEALAKQKSGQDHRRIGKVLIDDNKMTTAEVKKVLNSQVELETVMPAKKKKTAAKKTAKKKPAKTATKKAAKKKPAKTATKKAAKKKPAKNKPSK